MMSKMFNSVVHLLLAGLLCLAGLTLGAPAGTAAGTTAAGAPLQFCPSDAGGVCFSIAVPTASANSGSGNIYFQIKAPSSLQWVALGTGSGMSGSNIFLMYQDGQGNVTLSPRLGRGYQPPTLDTSGTAARLTLLAGSGVSDDGATMTANVACSNCHEWDGGEMSLTSTASGWIAAWKQGSPLATTDRAVRIAQHDGNAQFAVDLTRATIGTDSNPFVTSQSSEGGNSTSGTDQGGSGSGSGSSGSGSPGSGSGITETTTRGPSTMLLAHGSILAAVMAVLFPVGSLLMPWSRRWWLHAIWQFVSFAAMWVGVGLGTVLVRDMNMDFTNPHFVVGYVVAALFTLQPILGMLHHRQFLATGLRGVYSFVHRYLGRIALVLGVVNGGLGLRLARAPERFVIAYGAVAGFMLVVYFGYKLCVYFGHGKRNVSTTGNDTDRSKEGPAGTSRRQSRQSRRQARRESSGGGSGEGSSGGSTGQSSGTRASV